MDWDYVHETSSPTRPWTETKEAIQETNKHTWKVTIPSYLKYADPKLKNLRWPEEVRAKLLYPGQKKVWVEKTCLVWWEELDKQNYSY